MNITIQFEASLRELAGTDSLPIQVQSGASVLDAVTQGLKELPDALGGRIFSDRGIQSSVLVFVNDCPVTAANGHTLQEGDTVLLLPPISGG